MTFALLLDIIPNVVKGLSLIYGGGKRNGETDKERDKVEKMAECKRRSEAGFKNSNEVGPVKFFR